MSRIHTSAGKTKTRYWGPPPGRVCRVRGYHTGEFIARVESVDRMVAVVTVLDPLRPFRKGTCPYPQCTAGEDHPGEHRFPSLCPGRTLEVLWRLAQFEPTTETPLEKSPKVIAFRRDTTPSPDPRGAA